MVKIKTLKYGRTFNLGNFRSERIDIEVELGSLEQNNTLPTFLKAKAMVELMHKAGLR